MHLLISPRVNDTALAAESHMLSELKAKGTVWSGGSYDLLQCKTFCGEGSAFCMHALSVALVVGDHAIGVCVGATLRSEWTAQAFRRCGRALQLIDLGFVVVRVRHVGHIGVAELFGKQERAWRNLDRYT